MFVIESGDAEVRKDGQVIGALHAGDVSGEIGVLATGTRTASVVATSRMRLAAMLLRDFKQIEQRMPAVAESLRETLAERARTGF